MRSQRSSALAAQSSSLPVLGGSPFAHSGPAFLQPEPSCEPRLAQLSALPEDSARPRPSEKRDPAMVEPDARRVLACGCLRAGAPSAGKCTSRGRRGASPGATLPSRRAGDRLCRLLLALARRHWRLHHPARDAHRVLACNCHRARAPSAATCISRGCGRLPAPWGWAVAG